MLPANLDPLCKNLFVNSARSAKLVVKDIKVFVRLFRVSTTLVEEYKLRATVLKHFLVRFKPLQKYSNFVDLINVIIRLNIDFLVGNNHYKHIRHRCLLCSYCSVLDGALKNFLQNNTEYERIGMYYRLKP